MREWVGDGMHTPKYDRKAVGSLLQDARKATGLTQEQVAEAAGCSHRHIISIEGGTAGISIDLLLTLCALYRITPNDALTAILLGNQKERSGDELRLAVLFRGLSKDKQKVALALLSALAHMEE